jgi:hypothetical protein
MLGGQSLLDAEAFLKEAEVTRLRKFFLLIDAQGHRSLQSCFDPQSRVPAATRRHQSVSAFRHLHKRLRVVEWATEEPRLPFLTP